MYAGCASLHVLCYDLYHVLEDNESSCDEDINVIMEQKFNPWIGRIFLRLTGSLM